MSCVLLVVLATLFAVTVSQVQITADKSNVINGQRVVLTGTVPDFTDNVAVIQGTSTSRALCLPNLPCNTDTSAYSVTQTGTNIIFTILSFSNARDVGSWFIRYGTSSVSNSLTLSEFTPSVDNSLCVGSGKAYTLTIVCSDVLPIVKILIILLLWKYKYCKHTFIRLKPIGKNCRIAVTAQKTLKSATWKIQKKDQQPILHLKNGYTIDVRRGQLLECMFATDAGVLELSFQNKGDLLHVERDQTITLPTLLKVNHMFPIVKWRFNGRLIQNDDLQFITKVTSSTFGVYDIEMTFKEHKIIIWIQNIIVKESKRDKTDSDESTEDEGDPPSRPPVRGLPSVGGWPLWLWLLNICVFVDLSFAILGGSITWWKRSTNGFCVEKNFIITIVGVSFLLFTIVEIALILMIKRTGDEKGSRSKKTVNAMTAAETGAMSASDGDPKTSKNQNGPNWQPPNK